MVSFNLGIPHHGHTAGATRTRYITKGLRDEPHHQHVFNYCQWDHNWQENVRNGK